AQLIYDLKMANPEANVSVAMMDRLPEDDRRKLAGLLDDLAAADPITEAELLSQRSISVTKLIYLSKRLLGTDVVVDGAVLDNQRLNLPERPTAELRQVSLVQNQTSRTWVLVAPAKQAEPLRRGDLVRARGRFFKLRRLDKNAPPEKSEPVVVAVQLKRFAPTPVAPSSSPVVTVVVLVLGVVVVVVVLVARQRSARRSPVDWSTMLSDRLSDDPAFFEDNVAPPTDTDRPETGNRKDDPL
ncbi:MAG: hypothetical protein ACOCXX_03495, partial [Planctomycetota bacterium]